MIVYSINDLEKLSGIKAHTLRIWEKRYGILQPQRTKTNIRYYLDKDLQHLLNVAYLNKRGIKISKIANLSNEEIKRKVAEYSNVDVEFEEQLDALTLAMFDFDEYNFDKILTHNIDQKGLKETMLTVIYPLLDKITMMWISGSVKKVHESFIIEVIRKKTILAIDKIPKNKNRLTKKYLIYLPKGENQELTLLFIEFLLKSAGYRVLNLGLNVDKEQVNDAIVEFAPDFIMSVFNESFMDASLENYINDLLSQNEFTKFIATGFVPIKQRLKASSRCLIKNSLEDVMSFINSFAVRASN